MKSFDEAAKNFKGDREEYFKGRYGAVCREIAEANESPAIVASILSAGEEEGSNPGMMLLAILQLGVCIGIEMRGGIQIQ